MIRTILVVLALVVVLMLCICISVRRPPREIEFTITDGVGPMANMVIEGSDVQLSTVLDTGSIYLLIGSDIRSNPDPSIPLPKGVQTYYYAGPSASFEWKTARIRLSGYSISTPNADLPVGEVTPDTRSSLGVPAVMGLCPLPKWASQRFGVQSLVGYAGIERVYFDFVQNRLLFDPWSWQLPSTDPVVIPMTPKISVPTPGLGYLTTEITGLTVEFSSPDKSGLPEWYTLTRIPAKETLPQTYQVSYTTSTGQEGVLSATEWWCLFDTGTYQALFYADASVNLLGDRVSQSMVPGQTDDQDFVPARISYSFGPTTVSASDVPVPKFMPTRLQNIHSLMTVCGYAFQAGKRVGYVCGTNQLPKQVEFYST